MKPLVLALSLAVTAPHGSLLLSECMSADADETEHACARGADCPHDHHQERSNNAHCHSNDSKHAPASKLTCGCEGGHGNRLQATGAPDRLGPLDGGLKSVLVDIMRVTWVDVVLREGPSITPPTPPPERA